MPIATLPEVLNSSIRRALSEIHTCLPARVESYDHTQQRASVKPLVKKKYRDGTEASLPVIVDVPVIWPRSSNASMTFPVNKGDYVMIIMAERSIERFLSLGGEQLPGDFRKFDLSDAIAVPGLFPFSVPSRSDNNEDVLLIYNDSSVRIKKNGDYEIVCSNNENVTVAGNVTVNIGGNADITVGGTVNMSVTNSVNITTPTTNINGDVNISGTLNAAGSMTAAAGGITMTQPLSNTAQISSDTDVVSNVSLNGHVHGGVAPGGADTSGPK